jgi:formylglycine-generating enzyme required for sulfatase activity
LANWNTDGPVEVGSYPAGASLQGVFDLTGNVWEWTASLHCSYADPLQCNSQRVARGGGWSTTGQDYLRAWARDTEEAADARYGFRCAF